MVCLSLQVPELEKATVQMKNPEQVKKIVSLLRKGGAGRLQVCVSLSCPLIFKDFCLFAQAGFSFVVWSETILDWSKNPRAKCLHPCLAFLLFISRAHGGLPEILLGCFSHLSSLVLPLLDRFWEAVVQKCLEDLPIFCFIYRSSVHEKVEKSEACSMG